jgi:hypothetical protein
MVNRSIRLLETGGRARRLAGVLLGATLLALPGAVPAAAQGAFKNVGDERVVGKNRTGEVVLTTTTFDAQARDPALGRAEALRRAQLVLAADKGTSHPFYWAPFVLVGDGGAPAPP